MKYRLKLFTYAFQETPHMCSEIPLKSIKNVSNAIVLHFPLLFLAQTLLNVGAQVKSFFFHFSLSYFDITRRNTKFT